MNKTMKVFVFCLALFLPISSHARRPDDNFIQGMGAVISACFHPTARYESIDLPYFPEFGDKQTEVAGTIYFYGGFTGNSYYMSFVMQGRSIENPTRFQPQFRIIPQSDTAPFPPNPSCAFRDWTDF
jgi:hypothetical protein